MINPRLKASQNQGQEKQQRRERNSQRKKSLKQIVNKGKQVNGTAQKESRTRSRYQRKQNTQIKLHNDYPEFLQPDPREAIRYWVIISGILGLVAINLILSHAALSHFIQSEGGSYKLQFLAIVVVPLVMILTAIMLAYKREDLEQLGNSPVGWYFLSFGFLLLMSSLSVATQLAVAEFNLTLSDWLLLGFKVGLNLVVEATILGGGVALVEALGYLSFNIKNSWLKLRIVLYEWDLARLEVKAINLINEIGNIIDSYNERFPPDTIAAPIWIGLARLLVNRLAERELIPPPVPTSPDLNTTEPKPDTVQTEPPAASTVSEEGTAEAEYKRNFDEANARRRDREVEP
jgi:hypothetical protein